METLKIKEVKKSMRILFEIWGNFTKWHEVNYLYENENIKSTTTLPLLYKKIQPDFCYVIVSDTLIDNWIDSNNIYTTYENILNKVNNEAYNFIKEKMNSTQNIEVLVLPGSGTFEKSQFNGNPLNFYSIVYWKTIKRILDIIEQNSYLEKLEIYLDITHGINYMTMMTYRALKEIFQILAYFYKVKFIVLNSDPKVGSENVDLNINEIEKTNIIPAFNFFYYTQNKFLIPSKNIEDSEKKDIGEKIESKSDDLKSKMENLYTFSGAFMHGLPLCFYLFYEELKIYEIEKLINLFSQFISISIPEDNKKLSIIQQTVFTGNFLSLLQAFLLSKILAKKYGIEKKENISFNDIKELENIFKNSRAIKQRLNKEIEKIKDKYNSITQEFKDYGYYAMEKEEYKENNNFDERNFYAHCGFGYNIIQIKKENNDIIIKVKNDLVDRVKNNLLANIQKGD